MEIRNESDLKAFYDSRYATAVRQAFRIVNDLEEAEDIVQECLVRLWEKRTGIAQDQPIGPYFHTMVRNRSIDALRRRPLQDNSTDISDLEFSPPDILEYGELESAINAIIDGLPEKCRRIFVLSRFEGMTYREISERLDISVKTVETQVSRALKTLRTGLGEHLFSFFF